jgi:ACS family pantothenate transporter-like MFS transporter
MAKLEDQEVQVQQQAVEVIDAEPKRKWQSYIWDSLDKSPEERHFLFKLDSAVLTFASLGQYQKSSQSRMHTDTFAQDTSSNI